MRKCIFAKSNASIAKKAVHGLKPCEILIAHSRSFTNQTSKNQTSKDNPTILETALCISHVHRVSTRAKQERQPAHLKAIQKQHALPCGAAPTGINPQRSRNCYHFQLSPIVTYVPIVLYTYDLTINNFKRPILRNRQGPCYHPKTLNDHPSFDLAKTINPEGF